MNTRTSILWRVATAAIALPLSSVPLFAQVGRVPPGKAPLSPVGYVNPQSLALHTSVCGGVTQQGTPIAGNAVGSGTSGSITIAGIPSSATVKKATLYWTVLTNDLETSNTGGSIEFDGSGVTGTKIGTRNGTPCFPQANTIAWKADVTALVLNPGNGTYTVSGFPGGNATAGPNFTEGVTLQILWTDPSAPLQDVAVYETPVGTGGLAVTNDIGDTFNQTLSFNINASGPPSGTLYEVIGNGQSAPETFNVSGPGGTVNLDNTLDGSTSEHAANTCSYTDSGTTDCFWDDDTPNITGALTNTATSVSMNYTLTSDCHDFPADTVSVSTDAAGVCVTGGQFVDAQCPPTGSYRNHGAYVSCVAHAAEAFLASLGCGASFPSAETESCIVNPRARSSVGK